MNVFIRTTWLERYENIDSLLNDYRKLEVVGEANFPTGEQAMLLRCYKEVFKSDIEKDLKHYRKNAAEFIENCFIQKQEPTSLADEVSH